MGAKRKERTDTSEAVEERIRQKRAAQNKLDVSFTKRRNGLFNKAARLCMDFDNTQLAVLVVSKASRPYSFGHSSVNKLLTRVYNIQPTTNNSLEGLNLLRQREQNNLMDVKEEIESEFKACQTVEELAWLREKYLKIDEDIRMKFTTCSSRDISFNNGVVDHKKGTDNFNVGDDGRSSGSMAENSDTEPLLALCSSDYNCSLGLGYEAGHNSSFASTTTSDYGVDDDWLRLDGGIGGEEWCSLGLDHDQVNGISFNTDESSLPSTASYWLSLLNGGGIDDEGE